jgi:hypothetical protein
MHSIATLAGAGFLLVPVQLLGSLAGPWISAVCGLGIGGLAFPLVAFFHLKALPWWVAPLLASSSSLAGVVVVGFARSGLPPEMWVGPVLAGVVASAVIAIERRQARRCKLCNHHLGAAGVAFTCPRCGLLVCEDCWVFELSRCQLCERNHVRILSPDARWWDRQIGPRSEFGRCQLCLKTAEEADLRSCRNCGRSQCTECWDAVNGQCNRCQWTIEDVPESLRVYLIHSPSAREARASRRR